eukprot:gene43863-59419_t
MATLTTQMTFENPNMTELVMDAISDGWRRGRAARNLNYERWEERMAEPVEALRREPQAPSLPWYARHREHDGESAMPATTNHTSVDDLNRANVGKLPGHLGLTITEVAEGRVVGTFQVRTDLVAHTGYLLAGVVLSVADILCAYGVSTAWPEEATGFTKAE